ncbi:hypothetical protein Droror1_Dr00022947 [Drosera rotundifolia]
MHHADITSPKPAVIAHTLCSSLGVLQVPQHQASSPENHFPEALSITPYALPGHRIDHIESGQSEGPDPLSRLQPRPLAPRQSIPLLLPGAGNHQTTRLRQPVPMADDESEGFSPVEDGGRRWGACGEDVDRRSEGFGGGGAAEHVENDGGTAHVGDPVAADGGIDDGGVESAETNVGGPDSSGSPCIGPGVGVEHGKGPEVNGLLREGPVNDGINCHDEAAAVAMDHPLGGGGRAGGVVEDNGFPIALRSDPDKIRIALRPQQILVLVDESIIIISSSIISSGDGGGVIMRVVHEDEDGFGGRGREEGEGAEEEGGELAIDEDEAGVGVAEDDGDGVGVEAGVDGVEDGAGHGDGELELVEGGDVGGQHGDHLATREDAAAEEGADGGGRLETAAPCLGPGEGGGVVDDGDAVAVNGGCAVQEGERGQHRRVRRVRSTQPIHAADSGGCQRERAHTLFRG